MKKMNQKIIHLWVFLGIAINSGLQAILLNILHGYQAGWLSRVTPTPHWDLPVAQGGVHLQYGVWDNSLGAWVRFHKRRTFALEAAARNCYRETGRSLDNGGCVGEPHIVFERCFVFPCILHCCMAIGRLQVAFIEARVEQLPKDTTAALRRQMHLPHTGAKLGATVSPNGAESQVLFLAWEELGPVLAYSPKDPQWQTLGLVFLRGHLRALSTDTLTTKDVEDTAVAPNYREHGCKPRC